MSAPAKAIQAAVVIAATILTRKAASAAFKRSTHQDPPMDPSDPSVQWDEALAWTISLSVAVGIARLVARRMTSKVLADG